LAELREFEDAAPLLRERRREWRACGQHGHEFVAEKLRLLKVIGLQEGQARS
jgi:hypothetical protein